MKLSNTATPKYYAAFRAKVMSGEIPVNQWISMEMNRIDALIANPHIYYAEDAMDGFINFCETEMTLTNGDDIHLLESFKLWGEQVFCWYYYIDRNVYVPKSEENPQGHYVMKRKLKRLTTKQYLIVARGAA
ncbi:MAG: terminase TerL endonuclease subunit, partial [Bacilli bacterium]